MTASRTALDLPGSTLSPHVVNTGVDFPNLPESAATTNGAGGTITCGVPGNRPRRKVVRGSLNIEHVVYGESQIAIVADGMSTAVVNDCEADQSCPMPTIIRDGIEAPEGHPI
jgi:hypothetical protein